jgi:hypothetical protein
MQTEGSRHGRHRWARRCAVSGLLSALLLSGAAADALAQRRDPVITAPLPIGPPDEAPVERTERTKPAPLTPRADDGDRGLLGAPVFVPPGTVPYYAAPQYPAAPTYTGPAYYGPNYGPAAPGTTGPTIGPPRCLQYAPAYDETGRFLANVCVR